MKEYGNSNIEFDQKEKERGLAAAAELLDAWNVYLDEYDIAIDSAETPEERRKGYDALRHAKETFVNGLVRDAAKFQHVFKTEKSSVYVQTQEGKTVRFKKYQMAPDVFEYRIQQPSSYIFYIDAGVAAEFVQARNSVHLLVERKFMTTDYKVGAQPIEFMLDPDFDEYFEVEVLSDGFVIRLKKDIPSHIEPALPNHIGHPISEIYK